MKEMIFHKTQKIVASSKKRFKVLNCGRGWGKTQYAVEEAIHKALAKSGRRVLYVAPTIQQARDISWSRFKERAEPILVKAKESPSLELTIKTIDGGESVIVLRGWEAIETMRGQEFDYIVLDEVASMRNFWAGWQEVLLPTFRMSRGGALFISTPRGFNHFYDLYNTQGKDWESFTFTTYDNPYINEQEIEDAKESSTEDKFAQEYMADFRKQEGLVYKEFNRTRHTYETLPDIKIIDKVISVDFGFRHPAAALTFLIDSDGNYYLDEEWYKTERTEDDIADYIASQNPSKVYPDPENQSAIEVLRRKGLNIRDVSKGRGSVQTGIGLVREAFLQGRLKINQSCVNTITELETYHYSETNSKGMMNENPEKIDDDAMDSMRYFVMTYQPPKIISPLDRLRQNARRQERIKPKFR